MSDTVLQQPVLHNGDQPGGDRARALDSTRLRDSLQQLLAAETLDSMRQSIASIREWLQAVPADQQTTAASEPPAAQSLPYLLAALEQIAQTRTLERARYYILRLIKSISETRTSAINDINLNRWKEYEHIYTESLWIEKRRDNSGAHAADYWGNFIPQIPRQMMWRYSRQGEWVLDTFAGLGTTLIEGRQLGRHTLGIELQAATAERARQRVANEANPLQVVSEIVTDDSTTVDFPALLQHYGQRSVQLVLMHPPYFDIIKFSQDARDLSNAASIDDFLARMGAAIDNVTPVLDRGRYLVLVIGDKYAAGEWIPLGFYTMQEVIKRGFLLKSIIVKNFEETTGKRKQQQLWRYRALLHGFYIFKHEYIFLFQKL